MTRYHAEHPIFLWGMAGVGKSTVGRHLALITGREFIDLDDEITREAGRGIEEIFETGGEVEFRILEAKALKALIERGGDPIVSLGGGALLNAELRRAARAAGPVICLSATVDTLLHRLADSHTRPLLSGGGLRERLEATLEKRQVAYQDVDLHSTTDGKTPDRLSRELIEMLESERAA